MKRHLLYSLLFFIHAVPFASGQGIHRLWGTAPLGGEIGAGTLFSTDGSGHDPVKHYDFGKYMPGIWPESNNLTEYGGKLYGMTPYGGYEDAGVIFSWDPAGNTYTLLYRFNWETGGAPYGSLTLKDGKLYGLTFEGGENNGGVIFSWDPLTGTYTKLFDFSDTDGYRPFADLILHEGKFYGTTSEGGANDDGVLFEWDPDLESYTRLHDFSEEEGSYAVGNVTVKDGKLYGMTLKGGTHGMGTIFEWDFEWDNGTHSVLHHFDGDEGSSPWGSLTLYNNKFYGTTFEGGDTYDSGVLFEWDNGTFTVLYTFDGDHGAFPYGNPVFYNGKLYGVTSGGGDYDGGVIFEWGPGLEDYSVRHHFSMETGETPYGSMTLWNDTFYGLTGWGGLTDGGVLFEWDPVSGDYFDRQDLGSTLSLDILPLSNLAVKNGKLYGTSSLIGFIPKGSIFEWDPDTQSYLTKYSFQEDDGILPFGNLLLRNGKFYGVTLAGGAGGSGVIFEWDPDTGVYTSKHAFETGESPGMVQSFIQAGGKFYGTITFEESESTGILFEWDPDANGGDGAFSVKHTFLTGEEVDGAYPSGLAEKDGKLYGVTLMGGASEAGVIFECDPSTDGYSKLLDLPKPGDAETMYTGSLTLREDLFYGTASLGGDHGFGFLFTWSPGTNDFTIKHQFAEEDGVYPLGTLTLNNGKLYGIASEAEDIEKGLIYEWNPNTDTFLKTADLNSVETGGYGPIGLGLPFIQLTPAQVPVSSGAPGTCLPLSITIDASNSNDWVPVTDSYGNAIAEINANGNILGEVQVSVYVHNGTVREDGGKRLFLDRNITITPENPTLLPDTKVDVRLYIRSGELLSLIDALNTENMPSGVEDIDDIRIFKSDVNNCSGLLEETAVPLITVASEWNKGYVLSTGITSFSSFYFASSAHTTLPVRLTDLKARLENTDGLLSWQTAGEKNFSHFEIERSVNGQTFETIGSQAGKSGIGSAFYTFADRRIAEKVSGPVYYRLKMLDLDGSSDYSGLAVLHLPATVSSSVYPNPASVSLLVRLGRSESAVSWQVIDHTGRVMLRGPASGNHFTVDLGQLPAGIYHLNIQSPTNHYIHRFVKP